MISITANCREISFLESAERALYDLRFRYALGIEDIQSPVPGLSTIKHFSGMVTAINERKTAELGKNTVSVMR